jgi:hypothetical protein
MIPKILIKEQRCERGVRYPRAYHTHSVIPYCVFIVSAKLHKTDVRGSRQVPAPNCGAQARPSDFAAGLIRLSLFRRLVRSLRQIPRRTRRAGSSIPAIRSLRLSRPSSTWVRSGGTTPPPPRCRTCSGAESLRTSLSSKVSTCQNC